MTRRVLCLWIPNWSVQRLQIRQPGLRDRPLVLFADGARNQSIVVTHDQRAAALGVRCGMPLAEAQTLCLDRCRGAEPCFVWRDAAGDREALQRLSRSCERFGLLVTLEDSQSPESLLLDITGCGPLFNGEEGLARQLLQHAEKQGLRVRIAVADTVGAAWAIVHCGTQSEPVVRVSGEAMNEVLRSLPVSALRLSSCLITRLHEFQLRRIDQVLSLERSSLPSRFGSELLRRIDQAFGRLPEQIIPERRPEPVEANWESETPVQSTAALEAVMSRLLQEVLRTLQTKGAGVQHLQVHLSTPSRQTQVLSVECVRPTVGLTHLLELLRLRWERESFPQGICRVRLSVLQAGGMTKSPLALWPMNGEGNDPELLRLIERLSSRLGAAAVLRPVLVADSQPERSCTYEPAITGQDGGQFSPRKRPHRGRTKQMPTGILSRQIRPVWLLPAPVTLEVLLAAAGGPPCRFRWGQDYHVTCHWGPERITTGWWREEYIRRDYYHVQTAQGRRFWIFQELLSGAWFLHAVCD
jgi:protein ImuB